MFSLFLATISLIIILLVWEKLWKATILDRTRDELFKIRDNVRCFFIEQGYGLHHPLYKKLREQVNICIRYTEQINFCTFIAFLITLKMYPNYNNKLNIKINKQFYTDDPKLIELVKNVRYRSSTILTLHMFSKNIFICLIIFLLCIFLILCFFVEKIILCIFQNSLPKKALISFFVSFIVISPFMRKASVNMEKYTNKLFPIEYLSTCKAG